MPEVTVAILTYKCNSDLLRALESVVKSAGDMRFHLLVVDNDAAGSAFSVVESFCMTLVPGLCEVEYLVNRENNIGGARQLALQHCRTQYIAFIDSDCVAGTTWLREMLRTIQIEREHNSHVVAVGGANVPPMSVATNGYAASATDDFYFLVRMMRSVVWGHMNSVQLKLANARTTQDHLPTTNVIYSLREVLAAGGFSSLNKNFGEDIDLSYRLRARGGVLVYRDGLVVEHHESNTLEKWLYRAFRFGRAQWQVIFQTDASHMFNRRVLWPLGLMAGLISSLALSFYNERFFFIFSAYILGLLAACFLLCVKNKKIKMTFQLMNLFLISHWAYPAGQIYELSSQLRAKVSLWNFTKTFGPVAKWAQSFGFATSLRK